MSTISNSVLNSVAASAGDITLVGSKLNITGVPELVYKDIETIGNGVIRSLIEQVQIKEVAFTAANNTTYSFSVTQQVTKTTAETLADGVSSELRRAVVTFTSDASGTAAEIADAIVKTFNKLNLEIVASGAGTPVTFTANAGAPFFTITNVQNTTVTDNQPDITTALQAGSITNAAPRVATAVAHGLATGNTITFAGVTGAGAADVNGDKRVTVLTVDTFELDGTTATGTVAVGSATGDIKAQGSLGQPADLTDAGVIGGSAGNTYAQVKFTYSRLENGILGEERKSADNIHDIFVNETDADFGDFQTRLEEVFNSFVASGTTADPEVTALT